MYRPSWHTWYLERWGEAWRAGWGVPIARDDGDARRQAGCSRRRERRGRGDGPVAPEPLKCLLERVTNHRDTNHGAINHRSELGRRAGTGSVPAIVPAPLPSPSAPTAFNAAAAGRAAPPVCPTPPVGAGRRGGEDSSLLRYLRRVSHRRAPLLVGTATKAAHDDECEGEGEGEGEGDDDGDYNARGAARLDCRFTG